MGLMTLEYDENDFNDLLKDLDRLTDINDAFQDVILEQQKEISRLKSDILDLQKQLAHLKPDFML